MLRLIAKRFLETIPVLLIVATLTFFMMKRAPGGPFDSEKQTTPEIKAEIEKQYGLNKPVVVQYVDYLKQVARGDLGPSFKYPGWSVTELLWAGFPISLELGLYALAFALTLGLIAGVIAALRKNTVGDYLPMSFATFGICLPTFVTGPLLLLLFACWLTWFNASGWEQARDRVLPSITLGLYYTAYVARLTRGGMLEVLSQDFIRTARAKGASEWRVVWRHSLRGGLLSVVAFIGPAISGLVTGSLVVESIFQIPGLGRYFVMAGFNRDYTMVMGTVLFYALLIIVMNLFVDIVQVWLNPKLRFE